MASVDNKRVAKNAVALTLRMVLVTIVGLYTSRIVLQALGVDDYGIYGVIGGVVGMASFLNSSMAGATSRFITFELGRKNRERLKMIFSSALIIHFIIAIFVAILAETLGLWFVNNKMNFPADRMFSVNILYQFTIISMVVNFTQVPYTADIIAHEKMSIYAYFEIFNVILKLAIVYILLIIDTDRLILYAALTLLVTIISALIYRIYCINHFEEAHFNKICNKDIIREMLTFSSVDTYGQMCAIAKNQGQPIVLNLFYGVIANAGSTIAYTISGAVSGLTTSIMQAFRPQIIKQYSVGHIEKMEIGAKRAIQFTMLSFATVAIPIFVGSEMLLQLWLGQIPRYSASFLRLILISAIINIIINVNNACIHATGNNKNISFISGSMYLLCPIVSFVWLKNGGAAEIPYVVDIILMIVVSVLGLFFIRKQISFFNLSDYAHAILKCWLSILITFAIVSITDQFVIDDFIEQHNMTLELKAFSHLVLLSITSVIYTVIIAPILVFSKMERQYICNYLKIKFSKYYG